MDIVKAVKEKAAEFGNFVKDNAIDIAGVVSLLSVGGAGAYAILRVVKEYGVGEYAIYDKENEWLCGCKRPLSNLELSGILKECRERGCSITEILSERDIRTSVYSIRK